MIKIYLSRESRNILANNAASELDWPVKDRTERFTDDEVDALILALNKPNENGFISVTESQLDWIMDEADWAITCAS